MTCELVVVELTDEQKGRVCGILSVGCDRQTAANFVGCSVADIRRAMRRDAQFAASVCHGRAGCELSHMRNVQQAAQDARHWRASVWWLEHSLPERFVKRGASAVTSRQLEDFVAILVDTVSEAVHDAADLKRVVARLEAIGKSVDQMQHDTFGEARELCGTAIGSLTEGAVDDLESSPDEEWNDADGTSL
ncbi:MAG: hypothetical protein WD176_08140 [Pirellulales bacterium]